MIFKSWLITNVKSVSILLLLLPLLKLLFVMWCAWILTPICCVWYLVNILDETTLLLLFLELEDIIMWSCNTELYPKGKAKFGNVWLLHLMIFLQDFSHFSELNEKCSLCTYTYLIYNQFFNETIFYALLFVVTLKF